MKLPATITLLCFSVAAAPQDNASSAHILSVFHGLDPIPPRATALCGMRPAVESLELRTVLLIGPFSPEDAVPRSVEVVGQLEDIEGNSLVGLRGENVTALAAGPSLVFAERFAPGTPGLEGECPGDTSQAVLLTWEGGVTGPQGADLAESQRTAISVLLENGDRVHPLSLGDDDPDNHVIACIAESSPAASVSKKNPAHGRVLPNT